MDDEVVLSGDCGCRLEVIEILVENWAHAVAVSRGEGGDAFGATDKAGDCSVAEGMRGGFEEIGKDGAADVASGTSEKDSRWCCGSHGDAS